MPDVTMPRLSDSMEEGTILRWLKADGDEVARDEELVEIETDKATMTYESDAAGVLSIAVGEGETVPVGAVIARLGEEGAGEPAAVSAPAAASTPAAAGAAGSNGGAREQRPPVAAPIGSARDTDAVSASPVARRTARRLGVELATVAGSGPHGRIVKADVVAAHASAPEAEAAREVPAPARVAPVAEAAASDGRGPGTTQELTRTQALIARRMAESRSTVPDFALEVDVDMTAALDLRRRLKEVSDVPPSVNDIVVKASAVALRRHPRANGSYRDGRFELHDEVNVGVAVAAPDTLVVPTVRGADRLSLGAVAAETRRLIARVREGTVTPLELAGGTFTVSNLGMFGVDRFEGIVNPPQAAILCAGAIRNRPAVVDGEVVVRPLMTLTLACDHRILYGADAARFLAEIRGLLEEPLALAL